MSEKKPPVFYTVWSAAIVLCAFLAVFSLLFASCAKGDTSQPSRSVDAVDLQSYVIDSASGDVAATPTPTPNPVRLGLTEDAGQDYQDRLILLGDSTTYGMAVYYQAGYTTLCKPSQIWTPENGTLTLVYQSTALIVYPDTGEQMLILDAVKLKKPEYLIITLGVNGISFMEQDYFVSEYTSLVEGVQATSPNTRIILQSIFPVAASYGNLSQINNERIQEANVWIEGIAASTGTHYLNTYEALVGEDGWLPESYQNGDGIHLTGEAHEVVVHYIRTHAYLPDA